MPHERRLAAYAALGLFVSMFLPWYQRQFFIVVGGRLAPGSDSQTAWAQFSFVEAAVLLVAVGVLTLLFQRAEGKAFHLPGGDGWVIMAAGCWTCALIVWRIFDKQGGNAHGQNATTYGIEWGIFVALGVAAFLAYAGSRIRAAHRPEPPLPGEDERPPRAEQRSPRTEQRAPRAEQARPTAEPPDSRVGQAGRQPPEPAQPRRREVGWLTAPPRDTPAGPSRREHERKRSSDWKPPEWSGNEPREWSSPKPVPADEAPTIRRSHPDDEAPTIRRSDPDDEAPTIRRSDPDDEAPTIRRSDPLIPPSTPAARRGQDPDDHFTIPLDRDE
jgi:hypothetical protein